MNGSGLNVLKNVWGRICLVLLVGALGCPGAHAGNGPARELLKIHGEIFSYFVSPDASVAVARTRSYGRSLGVVDRVPVLADILSPRGTFGVCGNDLYNLQSGKHLRNLDWGSLRLFDAREKTLVYGYPSAPAWMDLETLEVRYLDPFVDDFDEFFISPRGRYLAALTGYSSTGEPGRLQMRRLPQGTMVGEMEIHPFCWKAVFLPDGDSFLCRNSAGELEWWASEPLTLKKRYPGKVVSFVLHPEGKQVAVGTRDGDISFVDLATGVRQGVFTAREFRADFFFFSGSGRFFCGVDNGFEKMNEPGQLTVVDVRSRERRINLNIPAVTSRIRPRPLGDDRVSLVSHDRLLTYDLACFDWAAAREAVDGVDRSDLDALYSVYEFYGNTPAGRSLEPHILAQVGRTKDLSQCLAAEAILRKVHQGVIRQWMLDGVRAAGNPAGFRWFIGRYPDYPGMVAVVDAYYRGIRAGAGEEGSREALVDYVLACPGAGDLSPVLGQVAARLEDELKASGKSREGRAKGLVKEIQALAVGARIRNEGLDRDGYYLLMGEYQRLLRRQYGGTRQGREYFEGREFQAYCRAVAGLSQRLDGVRNTPEDHVSELLKVVDGHLRNRAHSRGMADRFRRWVADWGTHLKDDQGG